MALKWKVEKDPNGRKDYGIDWTALLGVGETITNVVWTLPAEITSDSNVQSGNNTIIWLSGGTAGKKYPIKCRITTSRGMVDERTVTLGVSVQ